MKTNKTLLITILILLSIDSCTSILSLKKSNKKNPDLNNFFKEMKNFKSDINNKLDSLSKKSRDTMITTFKEELEKAVIIEKMADEKRLSSEEIRKIYENIK